MAPSPVLRRAVLPAVLLALALPALATATLPPYTEPQTQIPCPAANVCPDLVVDPVKLRQMSITTRTFSPTSCSVVEGHVTPGTHKLLRFTFTTPNVGQADLVVGRPQDHPEWFEWSDCHHHYHFNEYADYRLWTPEGYAAWSALRTAFPLQTAEEILDAHPDVAAQFVAGEKRGFCVIDVVGIAGLPGPGFRNYPGCGNQGITIGWADEYHWSLDGQWIVVDDVPAGRYVLEAEVNAERLYEEHAYYNNAAAVPVTLA